MRLERMAWVAVVLVMAVGCEQGDRASKDTAQKPQAVPESAPAPRGVEPAVPADPPSVGPFAARGPAPTLRMGRRAQPDGGILDSDQTDVFMINDPIRFAISMPEVADGAEARLSIQDPRTEQEVWQAQTGVTTGDSFLTFELGPGKLPPGDYVAVLAVDGLGVKQHAFTVSER